MSGWPDAAGVREVIAIITKVAGARAEVAKLEPQLAQLDKRCKELRENINVLDAELRKAMERMDVDGPGNFGWSGRISAFVTEMKRQLEEQLRAERPSGGPG